MAPDSPASEEIRRFEEQYRRQPESLVFARLADAYRKAGQPDRALALLEDGLTRHPEYPSGHIVRARALRDLGRLDETLQSFRRVLELDAANLVAIRELAGLADERGDVDESRHWYERLAQIDPTNIEVRARLAELERAAADSAAKGSVGDEEFGEPPAGGVMGEDLEEALALEEGPQTWWDDSAVTREPDATTPDGVETEDADRASDGGEDERRPEDDAVAAILNGEVPQTVKAEDTWWYEEAPTDKEPDPSRDADLLTRTMADLYAEQGLHREATEIYEELLKAAPGDPELVARLEALRSTVAPPVSSEAGAEEPKEALSPDGAHFDERFGVEPDTIDTTEPLAPSVGTPWVDELRGVLRAGEESASALPDPPPPALEAGKRGDSEAPGAGDPPEEPDSDPLSSFAREWIQGLERER